MRYIDITISQAGLRENPMALLDLSSAETRAGAGAVGPGREEIAGHLKMHMMHLHLHQMHSVRTNQA